ncbi:MAG: DUF4157 domain-containing protein, partial [Proteobacteria bacterium]|nr:DUF4157 domain-containing protein [Pseudomonadota bacterium]
QRASVLLALQRTHGNRYVQRVVAGIQAKLKVGQPGDVYEQEADRVAEQVMRMPEPEVQRQAEEEELIQSKPIAEPITPLVQRQEEEEEEEEKLQAKETSGQISEVTPYLESGIQSQKGNGQSLPENDRTFFESRFGYDFSPVRIHSDINSDMLNRALNARAFTIGHDVFFRQGGYSPGNSSDYQLLAHELTHVIQQTGEVQRKLAHSQWKDKYVQKADQIAQWLMRRQPEEILQMKAMTTRIRRQIVVGGKETVQTKGELHIRRKTVNGQTYIVQSGDKLQNIADAFGVTAEALMEANRSKLRTWSTRSGEKISGFNTGEIIIIPSSRTPLSKEGGEATPKTGISEGMKKTHEFFSNKAKVFWNKVISFWSEGASFWNKVKDSFTSDIEAVSDKEDETYVSYESQLDNVYQKGGVSGKNMCNVTTLAMQIETLAGSPERAKEGAINLLKKNNDSADEKELRKKQLEDLIMRRFELMGDAGWKKLDGKKPFWKGWYNWAKGLPNPWHQQSLPLNYVAMEFSGIVGKAEHAEAGPKISLESILSPEYFKSTLHPALKKGAAVMLSTKLTGGHIVLLVDVLDNGVLINDPYGMLLAKKGNYIKNGSSTKSSRLRQIKKHNEIVKLRLKYNRGLLDKLQEPESLGKTFPNNMGERNFYSWAEVKKYQIGKWNNILYGKSEKSKTTE